MENMQPDELRAALFWTRVIAGNIQKALDEHPHYDAQFATYLRERLAENQAEIQELEAAINDATAPNAVNVYV